MGQALTIGLVTNYLFQDIYGSPNLQVTEYWSKAGVLGIALEWPQNDCEVAFAHFSSGPDLLEPRVL